MPITTDCPSCGRRLRVLEELFGQQVRCPTCNAQFAVAQPQAATNDGPAPVEPGGAPPPQPAAGTSPQLTIDETEPTTIRGVPPPPRPFRAVPLDGDTPARRPLARACRRCGARLTDDARHCRSCGAEQDVDDRPWERGPWVRRDCEPHRAGLVLTLGVLGLVLMGALGLPFSIAAWVMGESDLRQMRQNLMDPAGWANTQAGRTCGIIGTVLNGLITLACLGWIALVVLDF